MESKKLPAFTIIEMTVAMLIAGIAISIAFTSFKIINGLYIDYKKRQDGFSDVLLLQKVFNSDFNGAEKIVKINNGLKLSSKKKVIIYSFEKDFIIRNHESLKLDTFKLEVYAIKCDFEQAEIQEQGLIDHFSISIEQNNTVLPMSFSKTYSSQDLIKNHALY